MQLQYHTTRPPGGPEQRIQAAGFKTFDGFRHGGDVGQRSRTLHATHGDSAQPARLNERQRREQCIDLKLHVTGNGVVQRQSRAFVRNVKHVDVRHRLQHFDREKLRRAAGGRGGQLPRARLGERYELLDVFHWKGRMHDQNGLRQGKLAVHGEVVNRIEIELTEQAWIDRVRRSRDQDGITVGCGARDDLRSDVGRRARTIVDNDGLPEQFGEPWTQQSRQDVGAAARYRRYDDADRLDL